MNDMKDLMMQCVPWKGVAGFSFEAIQVLETVNIGGEQIKFHLTFGYSIFLICTMSCMLFIIMILDDLTASCILSQYKS